MDALIPEVAHQMGLAPLLWLVVLRLLGERRDAAWWWLAGAFGVSWVADTVAHWVEPWVLSLVYPVSQTAIIAAVFLTREAAGVVLTGLVGVGLTAAVWQGASGPDLLLRTVAWLAVVGIVWPRRGLGKLRTSLLTAFGLGWMAWVGYTVEPGWATWGVYQGVRAVSLGLFCWAAWKPVSVRVV